MDKRPVSLRQRLVVPAALAISIASAVAAISTNIGCGTDKPRLDAGHGDGGVDTPIL
ncbi:MAG: hypothetical protein JWO36_1056 [Myxococcales bacterium]|nr:hypothetical protein [Myxococcales bacterium]